MFEMNMPALFGEDNKMLLWVGLGLMVAAIAVYVFMTRTADPAPQKACSPGDSACLLHPTEQLPTQITCITTESGEQVCADSQQPTA